MQIKSENDWFHSAMLATHELCDLELATELLGSLIYRTGPGCARRSSVRSSPNAPLPHVLCLGWEKAWIQNASLTQVDSIYLNPLVGLTVLYSADGISLSLCLCLSLSLSLSLFLSPSLLENSEYRLICKDQF